LYPIDRSQPNISYYVFSRPILQIDLWRFHSLYVKHDLSLTLYIDCTATSPDSPAPTNTGVDFELNSSFTL
jgi:hypothetical protein